jgi:hypothetical protein
VVWSAFADEMEKKIEEMATSKESPQPATDDGDKGLEPIKQEENAITSTSKSFFSCSSPVVADDGTISPPGTAIVLNYDYDLTTVTELNENTLAGLDDSITKNLADIYGLTACMRRYLRGLETDVVILALDSKPADVSVADTSECAPQIVDTTLQTFSCSPISGSMTAYVAPDTDIAAAKAKLTALIENGMASGVYTDDDIIKTSYVGSRPVVAAGDVVDAPIVNDKVPDTNVPVFNEIQATPLGEEEQASLAIVLSLFLAGFAVLVLVSAFFVRRRKKGFKEPFDDSSQKPVEPVKSVPNMEKVGSAESTVDLTENVASNTLSSSGEDDDLQYGMTEDYGDLANHFSTGQDMTQVTVANSSDLGARSFETGTPITTPIPSPVSSPGKLLPGILSPASSVEEDLLAGCADHELKARERLQDVDNGTTFDTIPL